MALFRLTSSGNRSCSLYLGACSLSPKVVKPCRTASFTTSSRLSFACRQNCPEWEWCECILVGVFARVVSGSRVEGREAESRRSECNGCRDSRGKTDSDDWGCKVSFSTRQGSCTHCVRYTLDCT